MVLSEPVREELNAVSRARHDWIREEGRQQRDVHGLYVRRSDQRISTTDPDATPMRLKSGGLHLGYHTHYVVDGGKQRIILSTLVTPAEVMDNQPMLDLLWHTIFRWHVHPSQVIGDTKYGTIENIKAIEDAHIRAYIPLPDWERMTPSGKALRPYIERLINFNLVIFPSTGPLLQGKIKPASTASMSDLMPFTKG